MAWPIYLLVLCLPFEPPGLTLPLFGLEFTLLEVVAAVAMVSVAASIFVRGLHRGWAERLTRTPLVPLALAFLVACWVCSMLAPPPQWMPFKFSLRVGAGVAALVLASVVLDTPDRARRLMVWLLAAGTLVALVGLVESVGWFDRQWTELFRPQAFHVGGAERVAATFSYPNIAAGFLVLSLPGAVMLAVRRPTRGWEQLVGVGLAILLFGVVLLTYSRGALLGALAGTLVFWCWARRRQEGWTTGRLAGLLALFALLAMVKAVVDPAFRLRATSDGDGGWYRAAFHPEIDELRLEPGVLERIPITVTNRGRMTWQHRGPRRFRLSYHWYDPLRRRVLETEGERTPLPGSIAPGQRLRLSARVRAPRRDGGYLLVWDMVQEHTTWFMSKGGRRRSQEPGRVIPVVVGAAGDVGKRPFSRTMSDLSGEAATLLDHAWFPDRWELWGLAVELFAENPWFGVGPDNFRWRYGPAANRTRWDTRVFSNSLYLETLATTGIAGAVPFFFLVGGAARGSWRLAVTERGRDPSLVSATIGAAIVGFLVHGLFDYLLAGTAVYLAFYLLLGAAAALLAHRAKTERDASNKVKTHAGCF